jgi:hypothetical protein
VDAKKLVVIWYYSVPDRGIGARIGLGFRAVGIMKIKRGNFFWDLGFMGRFFGRWMGGAAE